MEEFHPDQPDQLVNSQETFALDRINAAKVLSVRDFGWLVPFLASLENAFQIQIRKCLMIFS